MLEAYSGKQLGLLGDLTVAQAMPQFVCDPFSSRPKAANSQPQYTCQQRFSWHPSDAGLGPADASYALPPEVWHAAGEFAGRLRC